MQTTQSPVCPRERRTAVASSGTKLILYTLPWRTTDTAPPRVMLSCGRNERGRVQTLHAARQRSLTGDEMSAKVKESLTRFPYRSLRARRERGLRGVGRSTLDRTEA
jgi:hypothetical protein